MKLPEEYDEQPKMSTSAIYMIIGVSLFVVAILVFVLVSNGLENSSGKSAHTSTPAGNNKKPEVTVSGDTTDSRMNNGEKKLTPEDFDFWDMYPEEKEMPKESEPPKKEEVTEDPSTDGKHTLLTYADGKEEWVLISPYLPKNEYDFTKLVCQSNLMKYYQDGKKISYVGADISKYQDYVDFVKLRKAGVEFVMLRVGSRGYGSGQLMMDDYFTDNIKRATDAGLEVGVYFFSQAVSEAEAVEEANTVLANIKDYTVTYPVAFDMELVQNDTARIEGLGREEKTRIARAFLDTVKNAGYKPMIYGNKEWLIRNIDLSKLTAYDVWLSQPGDIPDYPYKFSMWQYSNTAAIDGIAGYANLDISFIDYSEK